MLINFYMIGCAQPISRDLYIIKNTEDFCIFTDNENTSLGSDNQFIVFIGEIRKNEPFKIVYSKEYINNKFPIHKNACLNIPVSNLKLNTVYDINLETNKIFSQRICLKQNDNNFEIIKLASEQLECI